MIQTLKWIRVEIYKFIHSPLALINLFVPLIGMVVFLAYYMISPWVEVQKVTVYLQVLAMAFPVLIGVISAMTAEREAMAGSFQMVLSAPCQKFIPHIASVGVLLLFGFISMLVAVVGFGSLFGAIGFRTFSVFFYLKATTLLFCGSIPLYLLQYLVGLFFGKGACLGLGIVGSLLSALLITGLGEGIWFFLPWGISIRFVSALSAYPNTLSWGYPGIANATCFLFGASAVLVLILVFGSKRWEGRKSEED